MKLLSDLFVNLSILGMLLFTLNLLTRKRKGFISASKSLLRKLQFGVGMGILGIVLMHYTIHSNGTIVDLRQIPVYIAAIYGGFFAPVAASLIIAAGRIGMFGFDKSTILASGLIILIGFCCGVLSKLKLSLLKKWFVMNFISLTLTSIVFSIIIKDQATVWKIYTGFWPVTLAGGLVILYLMEYLQQSKELFQSAERNAATDFLTGLNNVRRFDEILKESLWKADRHREQVSFILLDIDHFKQINDVHGHLSGNDVLKRLSTVLGESCRSIDILSRNGGEEFSVILPSCSKMQAIEVAERLRKAVEQTTFRLQNGTSIKITLSLGVSTYGDTTCDHDMLMKQADDCLYEAKRTGRNKVVAA